MVNCMPVFIAKGGYFGKQFEQHGLPIIGDDIKSQVGATITHRVLTSLFRERGVHLDRTMQLNVGGNSDFLNMLERDRLESKKISKTNAVTSMLDYDMGAKNVHVGPSDYVPWLTDRKWAYIRMEGTSFGDVPLNVELKLEVWDSPNSAGIVIDAVRLAKLALNNGVCGALEGPSAYLMKSPPKQIVDDEAHDLTEAFIKQYARKTAKAPGADDISSETSEGRSPGTGPSVQAGSGSASEGARVSLARHRRSLPPGTGSAWPSRPLGADAARDRSGSSGDAVAVGLRRADDARTTGTSPIPGLEAERVDPASRSRRPVGDAWPRRGSSPGSCSSGERRPALEDERVARVARPAGVAATSAPSATSAPASKRLMSSSSTSASASRAGLPADVDDDDRHDRLGGR